MPARVLITGATGFVGSNLLRRLIERGHEVHALVRSGHRTWRVDELGGAFEPHLADLLDRDRLDALFAAVRPHWVLHLAAYGAYATQTDVRSCVRTNVEGSVNLVDAAARSGAERFVYAGSSSEYGFKDEPPDEDALTEPNSLYAVTKAAATAYVCDAGRTGRLHATALRLYSVYGPYEEPTRLIPALVMHGLANGYPPLVAPQTARDLVYVDDAVAAFEAALLAGVPAGRVYNIGTGVQTTLRAAVEAARTQFAIAAEPRWGTMPARTWDTTAWVANIARARAELGWTPSVPFEDGFRRTAAWLSESAERRSFYETARAPLE